MAEWVVNKLSEVLDNKGYIRGPFGSALKRGDMKTEGVPVYEQQHAIYNSRQFRYFIDENKFREMKRFQLRENDLIISCSGTVGKVSIIKEGDPKGIISQALLLLRVNPSKIEPLFLKYFFESKEGYNSIISRSSGSVQVNIAKRDVIEQIPIKLPPIDIQKKITSMLFSIDEKIEENERINNNLQEQAQAIFRYMFLSNNNTTPATIADISLNVTDGVHNTVHDDPDGEYLLLSCKNIKGGHLTFGSNERTISKEVFEKLRKRTNLAKGDVLISSVGTVGELLLLNTNPEKYEFQRSVAMVKPNPTIVSPYYVYESLLAQRAELINSAHGAVQQCLFIADVAGFPINIPHQDDLCKFNALVEPMFNTITSNEEESTRLASLRDTLLPKLMSGEVNVSSINL